MRIGLLSDIHGNMVALEAVLADMRRHGPFDVIVAAGDLVWAGPWPAEVIDWARRSGALVLQGNTDAFFLRSPDDPPEDKEGDNFRRPVSLDAGTAWPGTGGLPAKPPVCPSHYRCARPRSPDSAREPG